MQSMHGSFLGQTPRQVRPQPKKRQQQLTADQVTQLKSAFSRIDVNGDGDISKSEIMSTVAKSSELCDLLGLDLHPNASVEERMFEAGVLFKDMDTDGNSTIDEDEFIAFFGILASDDVEAPTATNAEVSSTEHADNEDKHPERLVPGGTSGQDADARP